MLSAIMLALILTTLSILVLGLVLSQAMPTQFQRKSTQTVYAAEAGIETALSSVRTALGSEDFVGAVYGDIRKLPCALEGDGRDARWRPGLQGHGPVLPRQPGGSERVVAELEEAVVRARQRDHAAAAVRVHHVHG